MSSHDDVMGTRCRWLGSHRADLPSTGRVVCADPGRYAPAGWWVLWDGQDGPRWEPASLVQVDRHPPAPAPASVGASGGLAAQLTAIINATAKADR